VLILPGRQHQLHGFPFLASFARPTLPAPPDDQRGTGSVFSTGIIALTVVAILLLLVTTPGGPLIPLYAIGVFTGFTMAGAGMGIHLRTKELQWPARHHQRTARCSRSSSTS